MTATPRSARIAWVGWRSAFIACPAPDFYRQGPRSRALQRRKPCHGGEGPDPSFRCFSGGGKPALADGSCRDAVYGRTAQSRHSPRHAPMTAERTNPTFAATAKSDALEVHRRHEGRIPDIRCWCETGRSPHWKPTFRRMRNRIFRCGAEGCIEPGADVSKGHLRTIKIDKADIRKLDCC